MEKSKSAFRGDYCYYVMNKQDGVWVKVSEDYPDVRDAAEALKRLRDTYPEARLGGSRIRHTQPKPIPRPGLGRY